MRQYSIRSSTTRSIQTVYCSQIQPSCERHHKNMSVWRLNKEISCGPMALQTTVSAGIQDSTELHKVTPRVGRLSPRNCPNLHTNKETEHIMDRVPSTTGVSVLSEMLSSTNARGQNTMVRYFTPSHKSLQQSPKTIPVQTLHKAQEQEYGVHYRICSYLLNIQGRYQQLQYGEYTLFQHWWNTSEHYGCHGLPTLKYNR